MMNNFGLGTPMDDFTLDVKHGKPAAFLRQIKYILAGGPKIDGCDVVFFVQSVDITFRLMGFPPRAMGETGFSIQTQDYVYIMEFTLDGEAAEALRKIGEMNYARLFVHDRKKIFKIGVNFSSQSRTIAAWVIDDGLEVTSFGDTGKLAETIAPRATVTNKTVGGLVGEPVDLGLSVKWASWNLGANRPEAAGAYFAWGEVDARKEVYSWTSYKWMADGEASAEHITKYQIAADSKRRLEAEDDAATANWGGSWRMPTKLEIDELLSECTWKMKMGPGALRGYVITGPNGNTIFLPAAGAQDDEDGENHSLGLSGKYWSSSLSSRTENSCALEFSCEYKEFPEQGRKNLPRCFGLSIRPVCEVEA